MHLRHGQLTVLALVALSWPTAAPGQAPGPTPDNPYPYNADEPKAAALSLARAGEYLDGVARFWMRPQSCGACHANFPYLLARPLLDEPPPLLAETRLFLENRKGPSKVFSRQSYVSPAELAAIAFALAWDDAHTTGALRPTTRQALARMWAAQDPNGMWEKIGCTQFPPAEDDWYYTLTLAALAAGVAPEGYARTAGAQDGLTRLRRCLATHRAPDLHHRAMLLWASLHLDGLLTIGERAATVKELLAAQRADGGWSLSTLRTDPAVAWEWKKAERGSDGYATAFAVYVLRQAGLPGTRPEIARGVDWLRTNQRVSGRWFTPSRAAGDQTIGRVGARDLYIQALGTSFAVLALKASEVPQE